MMTKNTVLSHDVKVADEVWIATALLHRENRDRKDFSVEEIMARVRKEKMSGEVRAGVYVHIVQHCVANRAPNPGRYRMLVETGKNRRRLYCRGDSYDVRREGAKTVPDAEEMPPKYKGLLAWYHAEYEAENRKKPEEDRLLGLRGSGKDLWADEHADEYVRRLREGWE